MGSVAQGAIDSAFELANGQFNLAQGYAIEVYDTAIDAIEALGDTEIDLPMPEGIGINIPPWDYNFVFPDPIPPPFIDISFGPPPEEPPFEPLPEYEFPPFPEFPVSPPVIDIPVIPDVPPLDPIPDPPVTAEPVLPEKPIYMMPELPGLSFPSIPEIPEPDFPTFDAEPPSADGLVAPDISIIEGDTSKGFAEAKAEFITLWEKLMGDIEGKTPAYDSAAFDAMVNMDLEMQSQILADTLDRIAGEWSKRRFSLPNGTLIALIEEAQLGFANKRTDSSRAALVKNIEATNQNVIACYGAATTLCGVIAQHANSVAQRSFEASKATVEAHIARYNAEVTKFNVLTDIYKSRAAVYGEMIRAEIGKAEYYKLRIDAAKVGIEANDALVRIYVAQIDAIKAMIGIYTAEMEAAKIFTDVQRLKIEGYRAWIEGYSARVNALTSMYQMYKAKIDGEVAKVTVFSAQADAYKTQVSAVSEQIRGLTEKMKGVAEQNQAIAAIYQAKVQGYKATVDAKAVEIGRAHV